MGEARELFERLAAVLEEGSKKLARNYNPDLQRSGLTFSGLSNAINEILATQPDPVPELPEWASGPTIDGRYHVRLLPSIRVVALEVQDIERIGELDRILEVRRRAGR